MSSKAEHVFKGFLNLTSEEKNALIEEINNYYKESSTAQKSIIERFNKRADLGPLLSASCPCCGR